MNYAPYSFPSYTQEPASSVAEGARDGSSAQDERGGEAISNQYYQQYCYYPAPTGMVYNPQQAQQIWMPSAPLVYNNDNSSSLQSTNQGCQPIAPYVVDRATNGPKQVPFAGSENLRGSGHHTGYFFDPMTGAYCYFHPNIGAYLYDYATQSWKKLSDPSGNRTLSIDRAYSSSTVWYPHMSSLYCAQNGKHNSSIWPATSRLKKKLTNMELNPNNNFEVKIECKPECKPEIKPENKPENKPKNKVENKGPGGFKAMLQRLTGGLDFNTACKVGFIAFIAWMTISKRIRGAKSIAGLIAAALLSFDVFRTVKTLKEGGNKRSIADHSMSSSATDNCRQVGNNRDSNDDEEDEERGNRRNANAVSAPKKKGKSYLAELMEHAMAHAVLIGTRRTLGTNDISSWGSFTNDKVLKKLLFIMFEKYGKFLPLIGGGRDAPSEDESTGSDADESYYSNSDSQPERISDSRSPLVARDTQGSTWGNNDADLKGLLKEVVRAYKSELGSKNEMAGAPSNQDYYYQQQQQQQQYMNAYPAGDGINAPQNFAASMPAPAYGTPQQQQQPANSTAPQQYPVNNAGYNSISDKNKGNSDDEDEDYVSSLSGVGSLGNILLSSLLGTSGLAKNERSMKMIMTVVEKAMRYYRSQGDKRHKLLIAIGIAVFAGVLFLFKRRRHAVIAT